MMYRLRLQNSSPNTSQFYHLIIEDLLNLVRDIRHRRGFSEKEINFNLKQKD